MMKKTILGILFGSLILLLLGCGPTTGDANVEPAFEPAVQQETAVPTPQIESAPTETEPDPTTTPIPEETASPDPAEFLFSAEPLPTVPLEKGAMSVEPGQVIKSSPEQHPQAISAATQDLAERLNIDESAIEVVTVDMVVWSDTSMGCPHPEMAYLQIPQDGLRIRLLAEGQLYNYHSGGMRPPFLCETPVKNVKPQQGSGIDIVPPPGSDIDK